MYGTLKNTGHDYQWIAADARPPYSGERGLVRMLPWCSKLRDIILPGSVLVYARMIRLPSELSVEGWPFGRWSILGGLDGRRFEAELRSRGWHFQTWRKLVGWGCGLSYSGALARALQKIISCAENEYRNTLEIKTLKSGRLLSFHFVWVSAQPATVYWSREHVSNRPAA